MIFNSSNIYLLVYFFPTRTIFMRFIFSICKNLYLVVYAYTHINKVCYLSANIVKNLHLAKEDRLFYQENEIHTIHTVNLPAF